MSWLLLLLYVCVLNHIHDVMVWCVYTCMYVCMYVCMCVCVTVLIVFQCILDRPGDDSSGGARVLIESMQVQCKMYAEWIEVMSDYSTVFSDDRRGCAEHHFDKEKEKPDQEQQEETTGNSTVRTCFIFLY